MWGNLISIMNIQIQETFKILQMTAKNERFDVDFEVMFM